MRAVCEEKNGYYGLENPSHDFNTRYGRITQFLINQPSEKMKKSFAQYKCRFSNKRNFFCNQTRLLFFLMVIMQTI